MEHKRSVDWLFANLIWELDGYSVFDTLEVHRIHHRYLYKALLCLSCQHYALPTCTMNLSSTKIVFLMKIFYVHLLKVSLMYTMCIYCQLYLLIFIYMNFSYHAQHLYFTLLVFEKVARFFCLIAIVIDVCYSNLPFILTKVLFSLQWVCPSRHWDELVMANDHKSTSKILSTPKLYSIHKVRNRTQEVLKHLYLLPFYRNNKLKFFLYFGWLVVVVVFAWFWLANF